MNPVLATLFEHLDQHTANRRGELDGAAWRFVLPEAVAIAAWESRTDADGHDIAALNSRCEIVQAGELPSRVGTKLLVRRAGSAEGASCGADLVLTLGTGDNSGLPLSVVVEGDEVRSIGPANDEIVQTLAARHVGPLGSVSRPLKQRVRLAPAVERRQELASLRGGPSGPPTWLVTMGAAAGVDLANHQWLLWCRGDYSSQKLVMFLVPHGGVEPTIVVKITRDPRFNHRLATEATVLEQLTASTMDLSGRAPEVLFAGEHWGSFVCAERAMGGEELRPLLEQGRWGLIDDGVEWLIELGAQSARPVRGGEIHDACRDLLSRYIDLYKPEAAHRILLDEHIDLLASATLPTVVQHGDPGVWNALAGPDGRVGFLDWEAGEARGIPLWDVLYFLRSATLAAGGRQRWRTRLARVRRHLVTGSELTPIVADHVGRAAQRLGIAPELIEALVHTCWMQRAVKEAMRLAPARRSRGHYHQLLAAGIDGRDRPGFRSIVRGEIGREAAR